MKFGAGRLSHLLPSPNDALVPEKRERGKVRRILNDHHLLFRRTKELKHSF